MLLNYLIQNTNICKFGHPLPVFIIDKRYELNLSASQAPSGNNNQTNQVCIVPSAQVTSPFHRKLSEEQSAVRTTSHIPAFLNNKMIPCQVVT